MVDRRCMEDIDRLDHAVTRQAAEGYLGLA